MKPRLVDNWPDILRRAWSVRVAAFWGGVCALYAIWPVFADKMSTGAYVVIAILLGASIGVARILDQPGADI